MTLEEQLDQFDAKLRELTKEYEQYFSGLSKRQPYAARQQLGKLLRQISEQRSNNTQVRFRMSSLLSRYEAMTRFWDRTLLEMEKGTYKPDQFKADLRVGRIEEIKHGGPRKPLGAEAIERKPAQRAAPAPAETAGNELRRIYQEFVEARRSTRESTQVDFGKFAETIRSQREQLKTKLGSDVSFRVVVENGKTKLKASKKG